MTVQAINAKKANGSTTLSHIRRIDRKLVAWSSNGVWVWVW